MTRCDHGIRLDRFCADCEDGFAYVTEITETYEARRRALRRHSRTIAALTFVSLAVGVLYVATRSAS